MELLFKKGNALLRKGSFCVGDDLTLENYLTELILNYSSKSLQQFIVTYY